MTIAALKYIKDKMAMLGIPYAFMRWNDDPPGDYYFVGEYLETAMVTKEEDGRQDSTFILRGYTQGAWLLLEQAKADIEKNIGTTAILPDGTGIAVFYDFGQVVPTGDPDWKSIKINLTIQEWKVI